MTGRITDAGVFPEDIYPDKGFIDLEWEFRTEWGIIVADRRIYVSRDRAIQAVAELEIREATC